MKNNIKAVIFDFDYTLADSSKGICECVNYSLEKMGFPKASEECICRTIGLSLPETFISLVGEDYRYRAEEFRRIFKEKADQIMVESTIVFNPVPSVFCNLKKMGLKLAIVSTKYRFRIESVLERDSLIDMVDVIVGGEDVKKFKPDPEGVYEAVRRLGVEINECLYIGDSVVDAETAGRAGMRFAPVLTGVTPRESFEGFAVEMAFESLEDLPVFIMHENQVSKDSDYIYWQLS